MTLTLIHITSTAGVIGNVAMIARGGRWNLLNSMHSLDSALTGIMVSDGVGNSGNTTRSVFAEIVGAWCDVVRVLLRIASVISMG